MGFVFSATSQQVLKTNTDTFRPGLNIGVNGGFNHYLAEGNNFLNPNQGSYFSLLDNSGSIGRFALGYNFTRTIGIRAMVGFAQHYWPDILRTNPDGSFIVESFGSQNLTADVMVNLSNWWDGYNAKRFIDVSIFAGGGVGHRDKANFTSDWVSGLGRAGMQGDFRITDRLDLNLIGELNFVGDNYNDYIVSVPIDIYSAVTIGLTYNLASEGKKETAYDEPLLQPKSDLAENPVTDEPTTVPTTETVVEPVVEPEQLAKQEPAPVETIEVVPVPRVEQTQPIQQATDLWVNIFYTINKREITNTRQKEQIEKVVDYLSKNPDAKITVSGYADRGTGTASANNYVSKLRAENVTEMLKTVYAIPADRIQTIWYGSRKQLFKQNNMNRLTTVNSEGAEPFKKSAPQSSNSVKPASEDQSTGTTSEMKEDIIFTDNTANLVDKKQNDAIMMIAVYLRNNPNAKIVVNGYADKTTGTVDENIVLSKKRAVNVSNSLISKYSIDASRIHVKWFGTGVQPYGSKSEMNRLVRVSTVNI